MAIQPIMFAVGDSRTMVLHHGLRIPRTLSFVIVVLKVAILTKHILENPRVYLKNICIFDSIVFSSSLPDFKVKHRLQFL